VRTRPATSGQVRVALDGADRGTAPLTLRVEAGLREVTTQEAGGYPEVRLLRVEPGGRSEVTIRLSAGKP